jgi:hypothetical protein
MKKIFLLLMACLGMLSSVYALDVKTVTTTTEYKITSRDSGYLIGMQTPVNRIVKFIVPFERTNVFSVGAEIFGTTLSSGTIEISGEDGVTILQSDDAYRTKNMGSVFKLTRISRNFWILEGDLYSLQVDAYAGDSITLKANVDAGATGPLRFVWYRNNVVIAGQTRSTLQLTNVTSATAGSYRVDASNNAGLVKSETTTVLVR